MTNFEKTVIFCIVGCLIILGAMIGFRAIMRPHIPAQPPTPPVELREVPLTEWLQQEEQRLRPQLAMKPEDVPLLVKYSNILWALGKSEDARQIAKKARRLAPDREAPLLNLAMILYSLERDEEFQELMDSALNQFPSSPNVPFLLARHYARRNKPDRARKLLNKATDLALEAQDTSTFGDTIIVDMYRGERLLLLRDDAITTSPATP